MTRPIRRGAGRRALSLLSRWRRRSHPRVFHSPAYAFDLPLPHVDARRPDRILSHLAEVGAVKRGQVERAPRVTLAQLTLAHSPSYLQSLQDPGALTAVLGVDFPDERQDDFLASQRAVVGGTLQAALEARRRRGVTVNLGGGFHHATATRGQGLCTFNDVALAIRILRSRRFAGPVLVVDLDLHDGEGTRSIFAADPTVHTFSIHNRDLGDPEAVASTSIALGNGVGDETYLGTLRTELPAIVERHKPELVFFLAGCDPAIDDRLGDWRISGRALLERDRFVVESLRDGTRGVPLVLTLAGGYGRTAWRHSARSLAWLLTGREPAEPPETLELTLAEYRRTSRLVTVPQLTADPDPEPLVLTAEDLSGAAPPRTRMLGFYSKHGVEFALEQYGLLSRLRSLGFDSVNVEFDLDNPAGESVRLVDVGGTRELLAELRVRRDRRVLPGAGLLAVEWLLLQNPRQTFTEERPRLPGQTHPGLGLMREVSSMLMVACERLELDGILLTPANYHIAAQTETNFRFLDPRDEARFRAIQRALAGLRLLEASEVVERGRLIDERSAEPHSWTPRPMVLPVPPALKARFSGREYRAAVEQAAPEFRYRLAGH